MTTSRWCEAPVQKERTEGVCIEPEAPWAKMRGAVGSREVVSSGAAEKEEMEMGLEAFEGLGMVRS